MRSTLRFWLLCSTISLGTLTPVLAGQLTILNLNLTETGAQLSVVSDLGTTNEIETCTNLLAGDWSVVTNLVVTQSPYAVVDNYNPIGVQRFYRVVSSSAGLASGPADMVLIPAGSFQMGDTFNEGESYELPVHTVYVSAFYLGKYEVTKGLWDQVMAWSAGNGYSFDNPGAGKAANHPVESLNWYDMVKWCNARSEMEGKVPCYYTDSALTQVYKSGDVAPYVKWNAGYRLPTEAEWEKAARGGLSGHRFPWSDVDTITHQQANYFSDSSYSYDISATRSYDPLFDDGSFPYTSPVGSFAPNGYGVYDMAGNVWEWCWDYAGQYPSSPQTDPHGPDSGSTRVGRGGNWNYYAEHCRVAYRYGNDPTYSATNIGFRCALAAP